jgi:signal recognition particle receptor subunit beta
MPTIDPARGVLVIRVVYDGPALSGKTTSLRALAKGVSRDVECPGEKDGRTLYFDWVDYVGGIFEGRQIRCQIVSVPGQKQLARRRRFLLESADAVVCVLDTREPELEFGLQWLSELSKTCRAKNPPVGVVLQANKRDASDAVPREELRAQINQVAPIAIVESVARASDGIREAFVLAVRLALDRVRALSSEGKLESSTSYDDKAQDLLQKLEQAESVAEVALPEPAFSEPLPPLMDMTPPHQAEPADELAESIQEERVFVPDPMMPGGMIWPPVDGRTLLYEVASLEIKPARTPRGEWWGSGSGWRFHSHAHALYRDPNRARAELIDRARLHAANAAQISPGRAVILADAGLGRLRLWQLVRVEPVLRERLAGAMAAVEPRMVATGLLDVAMMLLTARDWFSKGATHLPCTLWTVGSDRSGRPTFVGLMPDAQGSAAAELPPAALLARELTPHLRELRRARVDYKEVFTELESLAGKTREHDPARLMGDVVRAFD